MSSYTYQPIDSGTSTIRLLRLFRDERQDNDESISGELFETELQDEHNISYDALSYTWGDSSKVAEIIIDGQNMAITANLHDALLHLRDPEEDQILWVDALCINQQDDFERTHQVAKMSFIYQKASTVIIWLGKTTYAIDQLLNFTRHLDKSVQKRPRPSDNARRWEVWTEEFHRLMNVSKFRLSREAKLALIDLLDRPWFRRAWVVQEAANAKAALIQCSSTSAPTRAFVMMPPLLGMRTNIHSQALLDVLPGLLRQSSWWNDDRSLITILQKFDECESTDPRDQIFALLGLSTDYAKDGQSFLPNYELNALESIQKTVFFLAFLEIPGPDMISMPYWNLREFRAYLPFLRPALLRWGIIQNEDGIPLIRKVLEQTSSDEINLPLFAFRSAYTNRILEKLPIDTNRSGIRPLFPDHLPLRLLILRRKPMELVRIFLEREDLDVHQIHAGLRDAVSTNHADAVHELLAQKRALDPEVILSCVQDSIRECCPIAITKALFSAACHPLRGVAQLDKSALLELAFDSDNTPAITMLLQGEIHPNTSTNLDEYTAIIASMSHDHENTAELLARLR